MSHAKYLIRFDDICPTMNWAMWERVEELLVRYSIKPILAVIPDNRHPELEFDTPKPDFWDRVRDWQARGWTIGLHGYQHRSLSHNGGIMAAMPFSEFAGCPHDDQKARLRAAREIFERQNVSPELWVAPWHSFDGDTISALENINLRTISDGFSAWPYTDRRGFFWIPLQLWNFKWRPFGVWSICYHPNCWGQAELRRFERDLQQYHQAVVSFPQVRTVYGARRAGWPEFVFPAAHRLYRQLSRWKTALRTSKSHPVQSAS